MRNIDSLLEDALDTIKDYNNGNIETEDIPFMVDELQLILEEIKEQYEKLPQLT